MLLDEIFAGVNFTTDNSSQNSNRRLDNVDLSGFVQVEIERGSENSAPYFALGFEVVLTGYSSQSVSFKIQFQNPLSIS